MFLTIISYVLGIAMEAVVPRWGWFRHFDPVRAGGSAFQFY
jgi:hypothetical protein